MIEILINLALGVVLGGALTLQFFHLADIPLSIFAVISLIAFLPVLKSTIEALVERTVTVDLLAATALTVSFLTGEWYSAAFINLMLAFARIFSVWTEMRERRVIESLLKYRPTTVRVQRGDRVMAIAHDEVRKGDLVIIESGDRIPVDGVVATGRASVNEATISGESELVAKVPGDKVIASARSRKGALARIKSKRTYDIRACPRWRPHRRGTP